MKVGDNILCKCALVTNNRKDNHVSGQQIHFFKGRYYKIVDYVFNVWEYEYVIKSELTNTCHIPERSIHAWFYNDKELRKLKLEKLNGSNV